MRNFGLIGFPLGHSFSKRYFTEKFKSQNIDAHYELYPLAEISLLSELLDKVENLCGLNVTIPYKQDVFTFLNDIDESAKEIGAVNTIKISNIGGVKKLKGFNTDYIGFTETLLPLLRPDIKKGLVLGTGGASKAVVYALKSLGITPTLVSRISGNGILSYSELTPEIMEDNLLIVNTTPLGMYPNVATAPEIPYSLLGPNHICYDLVYNPELTTFMRKSMEQGATVKNGLDMLYGQAEAAWEIWNS
ncbi:MAG: shikimate dehydrogenase [Muribaculaceae bacterium]|nr:shikimate dehydrogenase [Muribaculaceae bacterium]